MLNNLTNFLSIITGKMIKKVPEATDLITLGTRDSRYGGSYKPTAITVEDFIDSIPVTGVQSVVAGTNITVNNTNPANPIINAVVDNTGLKGVHTLRPLKSAQFTSNSLSCVATINGTYFQNLIVLTSYMPATNVTSQNLTIYATNIPTAGTLCRILVYSDNDGYAKDKLFESSDISMSTLGAKTALASLTFNAGTRYWLGIITNYSGNTAIASVATSGAIPTYVFNNSAGAMWSVQGYNSNFTSSAPNTLVESSITQPYIPTPYFVIQQA